MQTDTIVVGLTALARELRLARAWLKAELEAGRLPHLRAGRRPVFDLHAVRRALAERAGRSGVATAIEIGGSDAVS